MIEKGFELPFHVVIIGVDGSIIGLRYKESEQTLSCDVLVEHPASGEVQLPVNIVLVDSQGQAARILIKKPDEAGNIEYLC